MEERNLTCINCPMGCSLTVTLENGEVTSVTGNTCKRGEIYGKKEVTNPTRIVTSSVRVKNGDIPMVSCKTENDIPKGKIFEITKAITNLEVEAPVSIGDVILENVCDTGVNIVATKNINLR
jgi:CxxC motif-containing protein